MTKLSVSLFVGLMLGASMQVYANSNQTHDAAMQVAEAPQVKQGVNNAVRLKFLSRRGSRHAAHSDRSQTEVEKSAEVAARETKARKRLNRQFRSRRPYINYQFN